jgi:hypothetical protein
MGASQMAKPAEPHAGIDAGLQPVDERRRRGAHRPLVERPAPVTFAASYSVLGKPSPPRPAATSG